jgi:hypothetical protein
MKWSNVYLSTPSEAKEKKKILKEKPTMPLVSQFKDLLVWMKSLNFWIVLSVVNFILAVVIFLLSVATLFVNMGWF